MNEFNGYVRSFPAGSLLTGARQEDAGRNVIGEEVHCHRCPVS
jgi:hypothetical protein